MTEISFRGAAQKGICYLGSLKFLEDNNLWSIKKTKKISCVSIGAILSALYVIGYTNDEILHIAIDIDFPSIQDYYFKDYTMFEGSVLKKKITNYFAKKVPENITMRELYAITNIDLIISVTSLEEGMHYIDKTYDYKLIDVVLASCTIPFVFKPYKIEGSELTYIDGGTIDNFPIHILDKGALGFTIHGETENNFFEKFLSLIKSKIEPKRNIHDYHIIYINIGHYTVNFDINKDDIVTMYYVGYNEMKRNVDIYYKYLHYDSYKNVLKQLGL